MGGCSKKVQSGPALNWKPSDPERQKKLKKLQMNQLMRGITNLRRAGFPVQWSSDMTSILVVCDSIQVEDNGEGLKVTVEGIDITDQIASARTLSTPKGDTRIMTDWKKLPFVTTTNEKGEIVERDKVR